MVIFYEFSEIGFTKLFCDYEKLKKSAAGLVIVWPLFAGAGDLANSDFGAKIVGYFLRVMILTND
jgi:hypothetical protein